MKIRIGQKWKAKNNPNVLTVVQKRGDRWTLVREGGRGKVHNMSEQTINRYYTLVDKSDEMACSGPILPY